MNSDALRSQVRAPKACRGSTLIETLVATGIAATVLAALCLLSMYASRSFAAMGNYSDLDRASRNALDRMTRDIRSASYLVSYATNQLVFNAGGATNLTFTWDPAARTVVRSKTGEPSTTLLIDLVLCAIIGITLASYLVMATTEEKTVRRSQVWNGCLAYGEAGVEDALAHLNSPSGFSGVLASDGWTLQADGSFSVTRNLD